MMQVTIRSVGFSISHVNTGHFRSTQFLSRPYQNHSAMIQEKMINHVSFKRQYPVIDEGPLRIHVGNIPFSWSEKHLREQFEVIFKTLTESYLFTDVPIGLCQIFGPIDDVEVVSNAQGSKGFGFLTFLRRRDGDRAMRVKHGTIADGRKITVSLAVAKSHSSISSFSSPPQTPARTIHESLNPSLPLVTPSSLLSAEAPMWLPVTPPLSNSWPLSPDSQSNGWIPNSPSLSSSPLSFLFPPLLNNTTTIENDRNGNHWQPTNSERIHEEKVYCKCCPHCGRSI